MDRHDAIDRDTMLSIFRWDVKAHDKGTNSKKAAQLTRRHGLKQYPDPANPNAFLYSRAECEAVWTKTRPMTKAA